MDSSGQSVSTNPLFNTVDATPLAATAKAANSSSNALNNRKFSDVLDKQQASEKVASTNGSERSASDTSSAGMSLQGVTEGVIEDAVDGVVEGFQLQLIAEGGKSLPAEGFALPLMVETGAVNSATLNASLTGEALVTATLVQSSDGSGQRLDSDAAVVVPEVNVQSFMMGNIATEAGLAGFNPTTANQIANAAPLAGIQIMGQGQRGEGQRGQSSGSVLNASAAVAQSATAVLSTDLDADVVNKPISGLATNHSVAGNLSSEFSSQLQSSLAQVISNSNSASAFAIDSTSASVTTETAASLNTLLSTEAPQAYRASAQASIQAAVPVEVGKPGWSDAVMERVMWMSSQQINKAEIALDPPELGPLQVRISTQGDQTTVSFTSQHSAVRDALDQGLPRLREMMDGQGLGLADVDVSDQHQQSQANHHNTDETVATDRDGDVDAVNAEQETSIAQLEEMKPLSLIDHYV